MLRISIKSKKTQKELDFGMFQTEQEGLTWFQPRIEQGMYGKKEYSYEQLVSEEVSAVTEEREVLDENSQSYDPPIYEEVELSPAIPAVYETIHVEAEYEIIVEDVTDITQKEQELKDKIELGSLIVSKCKKAIEYITGYNASQGYSFAQIDQLEEEFGDIYEALSKNRIDKAIMLLSEVEPNELVTQEFIDKLTEILSI